MRVKDSEIQSQIRKAYKTNPWVLDKLKDPQDFHRPGDPLIERSGRIYIPQDIQEGFVKE